MNQFRAICVIYASFCISAFGKDSAPSAGQLLGDILIYRAYRAAGQGRQITFGCLSAASFSGPNFVKMVRELNVEDQTKLYLVGKIVFSPDGETAITFREAFALKRREVQRKLNKLSSKDFTVIFQAFHVPENEWKVLEEQLRKVN